MVWIYSLLGISGLGAILSLIMKKLVTQAFIEKAGNVVDKFFYGVGVACTLGMSKATPLKGLWNKVFEPYVVIFLKLLLKNALNGVVRGLESDNKDTKD